MLSFSKGAVGAMLVTITILLSGCAGGTPNDAKPPATAPTVGSDSGAIQGVVTDTELTPIKNAQVALQSGVEDPVLTNEDGEFQFSEVPEGSHTVFITGLGYGSVARKVDVRVGEISNLAVQLDLLSPVDPFSVSEVKEGFIACGTGVGHQDVGGYTQVACGTNDPNQEFLFTYEFAKGLRGVLFEMTWKPTQALSKDLALILEKDGCGFTCEADDTFAEVQGCCYLRVALPVENLTKAEGAQPATDFSDKGGVIQSRTFPAFGEATNPTTVFTAQEFEIHVEYFYNELPHDWETRSNVVD